MNDIELPEKNSLVSDLQNRIDVQDAKLAAINNAAELTIANVQANQGLLDEADEARLAFIRLESDPDPEQPFTGELPQEVNDFLARLQEVTK
jgi:hypothetical protein